MAGCFLIGLLAATWLGWSVLAGLAFVVGCVLAAWYAAPSGLLTVVVARRSCSWARSYWSAR